MTKEKIIDIKRLDKLLRCTRCRPNRGENTKKGCKHWQKSWKVKRKKQYKV